MAPNKILKFLASIKLAVPIIIALGVLTAAGTIVEAMYNAEIAGKLVYKTTWMFLVMGALSVNLIAVMVDRWPWKARHVPFLLAHVGLLLLLAGSVMTMKWGLDGSMRVGVGERNRWVTVPVTDLTLWASFDGSKFTRLFEREVDFFMNRPEKNPIAIETDAGPIKIIGYKPFVLPSRHVVSTQDERVGSGVRFQMQNDRVNVIEWLVQDRPGEPKSYDFGPAQMVLGRPAANHPFGNVIFLEPKGVEGLEYWVYSRTDPKPKTGFIKEGDKVQTGWMGLELRIIRYFPKAQWEWDLRELEHPTDLTSSVAEVEFRDKRYSLLRGDVLKFFTDKGAYVLKYGGRQIDLGFDVQLKKFEVGRYQGTMRAASYSSQVIVPDLGERTISMNDPLKHKGLTVYQASFEEDPNGGPPVASIFSVNQDPGRWVKYLGSLVLSLGIIWLFVDRRRAIKKPKLDEVLS